MPDSSSEDEFLAAIYPQDWPERALLRKLLNGGTFSEAAKEGKISRATLWRRCRDCPSFAALVAQARLLGEKRRRYLGWLRHPFRGRRPPVTGGGTMRVGSPKWSHGRWPG